MYVIEVTIGAAAINEFAIDGTYILPADRCTWVQENHVVTTATDTGHTVTSASPTSITLDADGNFRAEFPVGTMISPNADGSAAVAVTSTSYSGTDDDTSIAMVGGTFAINDSIYIVTQATDGYAIGGMRFWPGYNSSSGADVANGAIDFTATNTSSIRLGYIGKTGRFTAITN